MHSTNPPGPPASLQSEQPETVQHNTRLGLWLFAVYVILYAGFVLLSAFLTRVMGEDVAGVNLAIVYGFGLIAAAFILALVYMALCQKDSSTLAAAPTDAEGRA